MSTLRVDNITDLADDAVVTAGIVADGALPAGSILQVVSTTKTDTFSASLATGAEADVTGLSASITPSSTSSKIYCVVAINLDNSAGYDNGQYAWVERDGTAIGIGDGAGSRKRVAISTQADTNYTSMGSISLLDSPSSTSALTYQVAVAHGSGATRTIYVNRSVNDSDASSVARSVSSITLMEVAG